ncbi:AMP-binding protein [Paracoccus sp. MBLB3053]|uniref:AMP-binding protein n=1 Tax=Paracoccus aurantius TaxID=3073814 RepID=A0ABU2HZ96_9RHOB|nr:AMP-binding protein [Paracoccus sp. MBLB3053]MDS9470072.1 AMP-binding protein [Paracoccus sp. MBLB3053]
MSEAVFQWSPNARLNVAGRWLDEGDDAVTALERDLADLRSAIRSGQEFTIGPTGIQIVVPGKRGYFRSLSSGTTGAAKSIRRSHTSWIASFEVNRAFLGLGPSDRYGMLGMPAHSLTLYAISEAAHLGANLHCLGGLRPRRQAQLLADAAVTVLYATPTQLRLICETQVLLPDLRHILCGGGRLPPGLRARIAALCPHAVMREFYGAAETSFIAWGDGSGPENAVGRAYPGVELRIGSKGEIWVRSPYLFDGYAEGDSPDTKWSDGYVTVGEMGALDADGFLTVSGRQNRMVTIADQNVFPEDIESLLLSDPAITHCAVIPRPDPSRLVSLVAVIAGRSDPELRDQMLGVCREAFGPLAAPRQVIELADFPVTPSGKPDLREIARRLGIDE